VPELRRDLGHGHTLGDLDARVAVPEVVRVEVGDARALASFMPRLTVEQY
jgi:hypothetical protein